MSVQGAKLPILPKAKFTVGILKAHLSGFSDCRELGFKIYHNKGQFDALSSRVLEDPDGKVLIAVFVSR